MRRSLHVAALGGLLLAVAAKAGAAEPRRSLPAMPAAERPVINAGEDARTREIALLAWRRFQAAWATGDWDPFLGMTTDDFQFYFPQGAFAGLHEGREGKAVLVKWARYHRDAGNRLRSVATHVTVGGDTAVFETTAASIPEGGYRNYEALVFQIRGDRISALREYWNVLTPGADPSGN